MSYVKVDVPKSGSNSGVGGNKKAEIILFDMDDVLAYPARDASGVVSVDNITFNPGAYMIKVYATQSTIDAGHKGEGDPDKKGIIQTVKFEHPGDENAILEFTANWMNRNVGIIIQRCSDTKKKMYGTPCAPLQMVYDAKDTKDTNHTEFTFTSSQKGPIVCDYQGITTFDTVTGTVAADAIEVDVANGPGQYQITENTQITAITGLANAVDGASYTILGTGGFFTSTISAGGLWLLKNGAVWGAIAGASITFKAFKDGSSSFKFLEISRS